MKITSKEVEAVSSLDVASRYKYFLKKVADTERIYGLIDKNHNWAIADIDQHQLFSLWPAREYAEKCAIKEWIDYSVTEINLDEFEEIILPLIEENGYLLNIFSVGGKTGFIVTMDEFANDLNEEFKKF